jgi:hypothetical protein
MSEIRRKLVIVSLQSKPGLPPQGPPGARAMGGKKGAKLESKETANGQASWTTSLGSQGSCRSHEFEIPGAAGLDPTLPPLSRLAAHPRTAKEPHQTCDCCKLVGQTSVFCAVLLSEQLLEYRPGLPGAMSAAARTMAMVRTGSLWGDESNATSYMRYGAAQLLSIPSSGYHNSRSLCVNLLKC